MKKRYALLLFTLVGLLFLMVGCGGSSEPVPNIQIDEWTDTTLDQYLGKKVLMVFWNTTCAPCIGELPIIQQVYDKNLKDTVILQIGVGDINTMKKYAAQYKFKFLNDSKKVTFGKYKLTGTPTSVFLGKDGKEVTRKLGADTVDFYVKTLNQIP